MKWIQKTMVVAAIAALAGVAQASVTETFDGADWSDGTVVDGTNAWEHHSGTHTGAVVASDGAGYLGTRGAALSVTTGSPQAHHRKALGQTVSNGTFVVRALLNGDAGSQSGTGIGANNGAAWFGPGTIHLGMQPGGGACAGDTNAQLQLKDSSGTVTEEMVCLTLADLGWIEAQVRINLDNDSASA